MPVMTKKPKLLDFLTKTTLDTEGLLPGQTPLRDEGLSVGKGRFKDTIQGVKIDWDAWKNAPSDRKNFYYVEEDLVPVVIRRQWKNYLTKPERYGLTPESPLSDAIKVFDTQRPNNKIKDLLNKGVDVGTKIKDLGKDFDLSSLNPFAVKEAAADEGLAELGGRVVDDEGLAELGGRIVSEDDELAELGGWAVEEQKTFVDNAKTLFGETIKGVVRGGQNIAGGVGGLMDMLGQNIKEAKSFTVGDDNKRKIIGDKLSLWGRTAKDFWKKASQEGIAKPDMSLYQGSFIQNPSWTRAVSIIGEAIPSLGAATVASIATKNPVAGLAFLGMLEGEPIFAGAREKGASLQKATALFTASAVGTGILEVLPLTRFMRGGEGKILKDAFIGAVQEGGEEVLQQIFNNAIERYGFNNTKSLVEGIVESFIGGAGSGGVIGAVTSGRGIITDQQKKDAVKAGVPPQDIEVIEESVKNQIINNADKIETVIQQQENQANEERKVEEAYQNIVEEKEEETKGQAEAQVEGVTPKTFNLEEMPVKGELPPAKSVEEVKGISEEKIQQAIKDKNYASLNKQEFEEAKKRVESEEVAPSREQTQAWIMDTLTNDTTSTDAELVDYFMKEGEYDKPTAEFIVSKRNNVRDFMDEQIMKRVNAGKVEASPPSPTTAKAEIVEPSASQGQEIKPLTAEDAVAKGMSKEEWVGNQKPLYHGTKENFEIFDIEKSGDVQPSDWGKGVYFTENKSHAKNFAKISGGEVVLERYAPDVKFADGSKLLKDSDFMLALDDEMGFTSPAEYLSEKGFGGIKFKNPEGFTEYVVFDPKNIKTKSQLLSEYDAAKKKAEAKPVKVIKERKPAKYNIEKAVSREDFRTLIKAGNVKFPAYLAKNFAPEEIKKIRLLFKKDGGDLGKFAQELASQYPHLNIEGDADLLRKAIDQTGKELKQIEVDEEELDRQHEEWLKNNPEPTQEELDKINQEVQNKAEQEFWDEEIETGNVARIEENIAKEGTPAPPQESTAETRVTPSGQVRPELQAPIPSELFQEKGELFEKGKSSGARAAKGTFAEELPVQTATMELKPVESIEMIQLAKELMQGNIPITKKLPSSRGLFYPEGKGQIALNRNLFVRGQEKQLAATLAHEIGHLIDYLPEQTLKRGNLFGRLGSLRDFLKQTFPLSPKTPMDQILTPKDRRKIRYQAMDKAGPRPPKDEDAALAAWQQEVSEYYAEYIIEEIDRRGLIDIKGFREELLKLSFKWRPLDNSEIGEGQETELKGEGSYAAYREKGEEIYADAISALLNNPGLVQKEAPTFFKMFFDYLDRKPDVKKAYFNLQDFLNGTPEDVLKARQELIRRDMFAKGEELRLQKEEEKKLAKVNLFERTRQLLDDKFAPVLDKISKAKGREIVPSQDLPHLIQEWDLADNDNYMMLAETDEKVVKGLEANNLTLEDLGEYVFLRRVIGRTGEVTNKLFQLSQEEFKQKAQELGFAEFDDLDMKKVGELLKEISDREDIANPLGFAPETAQKQIDYLKQELGPDRYAALEKSAQAFHDIVFKSVEEAVRVGAYNEEVFNKIIKPNKDYYVSFGVLNYLQDYVPVGIKAQKGTLQAIENPIITTVLKTVSLNRLNARQRAVKAFVEHWKANFTDEIKPSKIRRVGGKPAGFIPERGKGMIQYLEDGRPMAYDVDPYIAESFEKTPPVIMQTASLLSKLLLNKPFKGLVITYNVGFSGYFNPVRDVKRAYASLSALGQPISVPRLIAELVKNYPRTWRSNQGINDDLIKEMIANKALDVPFIDYADDPRNDSLSRTMRKFRVIGEKTPDPKTVREKLIRGVMRAFEAIKFVGATNERLTKVAGYNYLKDKIKDDKARAWITRNYIGTPNFRTKGLITPITNEVFIFSNIMKEGLKADLKLATSPTTRGGWWLAHFKSNFFWKLLMVGASYGLAGAYIKDLFDRIPEYDKTNYIVIPFGKTKDGRALYLRIPHDETARLFSAVLWKVFRAPKNKDQLMTGVFSIGAGNLPSVAPMITISQAWLQYLSGKNPYDPFRGRYAVSEKTWEAGGFPVLKKMVQFSMNTSGFSQFATYDDRRNSTFEAVLQGTPGLNAVTRILKFSDYGLVEKMHRFNEEYREENADIYIKRNQLFKKHFKGYSIDDLDVVLAAAGDPKGDAKRIIESMSDELYGDHEKTNFDKTHKAFLKYIIREQNNPYAEAIAGATANATKEKILDEAKDNMTPSEFQSFIIKMNKAKLISKPILDKYQSTR